MPNEIQISDQTAQEISATEMQHGDLYILTATHHAGFAPVGCVATRADDRIVFLGRNTWSGLPNSSIRVRPLHPGESVTVTQEGES